MQILVFLAIFASIFTFYEFSQDAFASMYDGTKAGIMLTFEHATSDQLIAINEEMDDMIGTIVPISTRVGTSGHITKQDLLDLESRGFEIASHSSTHVVISDSTSASTLYYETVQSKKDLESMGFKIKGFTAPYNIVTSASFDLIKKNYEWTSFFDPISYQPQYMNLETLDYSKSNFGIYHEHAWGIGNGYAIDSFGDAKAKIDYAIANKLLLGFKFHEIIPGGELYLTSPQLFHDIIQYVKEKRNSGDLVVITRSEGLLGVKNACIPVISGNWFIATDCIVTDDILTPGNIDVQNGVTVTIPPGREFGTKLGYTLTNHGIINNYGIIDNSANLINYNAIYNENIISNHGKLENYGSIYNNKSINNYDQILNSGIIFDSATISNFDTMSNSGTINISNKAGTGISNSANSTFDNSDGVINISNIGGIGISNSLSSIFNNSGIIIISNPTNIGVSNSGTIINSNSIINLGTLTNLGILSNSGILTSSGSLTNQGTLTNTGTITTTGTFTNQGTLSNSDTLVNSGTLGNTGTITNHQIIAHTFPSAKYSGDGTLENYGKITLNGTIASKIDLLSLGYPSEITVFFILYGDSLTINSSASLTIPSDYTVINSGNITNTLGTIKNLGIIEGECGSSYTGILPEINSITDVCPSCSPSSEDWTITSSCQLSTSATVTGNVIIQNHSLLLIPDGITLDIDLATKHLMIKSGSNVVIKLGGTIN